MDCVQHIDSAKVNEGEKKDVELQNQRDESILGQRLLILTDEQPWKPWKWSRSWVKDFLVRVRCVMGSLMGMEWYCFAALGVLTAFLSFLMDLSVAKLLRAHQWLYSQLEGHCLLQFLCWTLYPVSLSALSTSFSQSICPFSAGSGVPEVRTILSGVDMPHYLSLTNLFAKYVGLICTLAAGSTVFLGKVGPFVHLSTMVGAYLNQLCTVLRGEKEERTEGAMLVVAAAVGVASCFGAPISGVLFSVEVMSSHFALKDYCPCFFAAACGALTFHLLSMWSGEQETLQALFQTSFSDDLPFYPLEIPVFAILGLLCGAGSCVYLFCHRWILLFIKTNKILIKVLSTEKALYSAMVVFLLASVTFPLSAGQYMASKQAVDLSIPQCLCGFAAKLVSLVRVDSFRESIPHSGILPIHEAVDAGVGMHLTPASRILYACLYLWCCYRTFIRGRIGICVPKWCLFRPGQESNQPWRLCTGWCSSILRGGHTHAVPCSPGSGADRPVHSRRTHSPRHTGGQCPGTLWAAAILLRCPLHQQEAPALTLPAQGLPKALLCPNREGPGSWRSSAGEGSWANGGSAGSQHLQPDTDPCG
ncbi:chloride channel K isoform X3 [Salvelinus sp. IW2-2015]|uniref:chloride channel K isoform X3 n=1 Tax=Salvelinus sp. IW2-2015 TaxID=2691554 RepID=UPI0038D47459